MTNDKKLIRDTRAEKWFILNTVQRLPFGKIAILHNLAHPEDKVNRDVISGAVFRYRKQRGIAPQKSVLGK